MEEGSTQTATRRERRRRPRFSDVYKSRAAWVVAALTVGAGFLGYQEMRASGLQAWIFADMARNVSYKVEPGANPNIWLPNSGPYDIRLGYSQMKAALPRLASAGFVVTAQARQSEAFLDLAGRGFYPIYKEKTQAGLTVLDRHGEMLYSNRYPQRQYDRFEDVPPLLVASLLYIENRELLDEDHPRRNPAVEWDRLGKAVAGQVIRAMDGEASRAGGSTLATQIEKFRHSPEGRTHNASEKLRQMTSASLRAYQDGEDTLAARRRIVLDFVNSVPLGAVPGAGEVNGVGDGLWAWYGKDFDEVNRRLAAFDKDPEAAAGPFKEALSLFVAQRRPSDLLAENIGRLSELTDAHLRLLAREGVISERLRDAALAIPLKRRDKAPSPPPVSFIERKAINSARANLADLMEVKDFYSLDRYDLTARATLDGPSQKAVTDFLGRMKDDSFLQCAGFKVERLLAKGNPAEVRYSFTLYEATPAGNLLRVQADNVDQPLDINVGTKLDLGSSAKFRTMVSYLEVITELHRRYGGLSNEELRKLKFQPGDNLSGWAVSYLMGSKDRDLQAMLQASLERRYSANPHEGFFTGGGLHTFVNFKHEDDGKNPTIGEALEQSVNLSFIRIMRDVVHYFAYEAEDAPGKALREGDEAARLKFLEHFADREGKEFLAHFYRKYRGTNPDELLPALVSDLRPLPSRLAAAYLSVEPASDFQSFTIFMRGQLGERAGDEAQLKRLYTVYAPLRLNLQDQGYVARVHPLELWLVGYLKRNPGATFDQVVAASGNERREAYRWLLNSRFRHAQDIRVKIVVEELAFEHIADHWHRLGYPFERLVPSYATAIGSSADRPAALAELMGIMVNDGVRRAPVRLEELHFAANTPFETRLEWKHQEAERVLPEEVAKVAKQALLRVVNSGTAKRVKDTYRDEAGKPLLVGGKTGTGDHRLDVYGPGGHLKYSRVMNRAATFVFYMGDRFFGTVTAFVPGEQAAAYEFTSALPVQVLKELEPRLRPLVSGKPAPEDSKCLALAKAPSE